MLAVWYKAGRWLHIGGGCQVSVLGAVGVAVVPIVLVDESWIVKDKGRVGRHGDGRRRGFGGEGQFWITTVHRGA